VARRANYKGDKRRKETDRLKKQEEKRQRRFAKARESDTGPEGPDAGVEGEVEAEADAS